jgi:uncharacterized protein YukE
LVVLFNKEGIMARIRVNTEDLQNKAKDFDSASEAFKRAGDDILAAAMAMPSYDGQLSGPARKMGYEFQKQARELSTALAGDADSLRKTAKAFEDVDNQAVNILNENLSILSQTPIYDCPGGENDAPVLNTNLDKLNYMISLSKPGDVIQVRMPDGTQITFIVTHDAEGKLILWNMNEGRAWDGADTIIFLAYSSTDIALYHMDTDGELNIDQTPGARIGDDINVPIPYQPVYWSEVGIQNGMDDPSTAYPPSTDNGCLQYDRQYDSYDGSKIIAGIALTLSAPWTGPIGVIGGVLQTVSGIEDFCKWLQGDYSITDVTYHEGINPPYSPLNQPYPS